MCRHFTIRLCVRFLFEFHLMLAKLDGQGHIAAIEEASTIDSPPPCNGQT